MKLSPTVGMATLAVVFCCLGSDALAQDTERKADPISADDVALSAGGAALMRLTKTTTPLSEQSVQAETGLAMTKKCADVTEQVQVSFFCNFKAGSAEEGVLQFDSYSSYGPDVDAMIGGGAAWLVPKSAGCLPLKEVSKLIGVAPTYNFFRQPIREPSGNAKYTPPEIVIYEYYFDDENEENFITVNVFFGCVDRISLSKAS